MGREIVEYYLKVNNAFVPIISEPVAIRILHPDGTEQSIPLGAAPQEGEWPKRDAVPFVRVVEVTDAMRKEGQKFLCAPFSGDTVDCIYRAMHAIASVEFCPEGRIAVLNDILDVRCNQISGLARQRDEARAERDSLVRLAAAANQMIDKLTDQNCEYGAKNERLQDEVDALTVEKNALQDRVSAFTAANVPDPPKSTPNPFREFPSDRRMIGQ